jgi:hypothetical protein
MMKKFGVILMAILFSLSVAGLSFAQTKPSDKPADKPAEKSAPVNPCAGKETTKKKTKAQKLAGKKAACLEKATTDQAKAECEKKFAEKSKKAKKTEDGTTMAPEKKAVAPAEKK